MSTALLVGPDQSLTRGCYQSLLNTVNETVAVTPTPLPVGRELTHFREDPLTTIGHGRIGDVIRQRGPFSCAVMVFPVLGAEANENYREVDLVLRSLATYVALTQGLSETAGSGVTTLIAVQAESQFHPLHAALNGFLKELASGHDSLGLRHVDARCGTSQTAVVATTGLPELTELVSAGSGFSDSAGD